MEMWFSLYEALEMKKMEVEVENWLMLQVLDDSIDHVIKDDKEESQHLYKKKKILEQELQELLNLVKLKQAEISENDSKIEYVEKKMADAVSSFHEAQMNIHSKSESLQSGLSQFELENDDLTRKKKEIDDFHLQEETRGSKIKDFGRISADEARMYQENINLLKVLIDYISKSREDKIRLAKKEQDLFDDVQILKQDIASVRASLQDLSSSKSEMQQAIESSKQSLLFLHKRVPEIESEKRVAATVRNFKEAARIANEAKALYVEKETLQLKIQQAMTDLKTLEDEVNNNVERLQEKEQTISLMEKELEIVRYEIDDEVHVNGHVSSLLDMLHGKALKSLEKLESPKLLSYPHDDRQKSEVQLEVTTKGKEKFDENGTRKFPITLKDNNALPIIIITDSPPKLQVELPKKKCAFQMSAPEDSYEMDDEVYVNNGHVSSSLVDHNKPESTSTPNKPIIEIPVLQEGSNSCALVKNNTPLVLSEVAKSPAMVENNNPEVSKIPERTELKEAEDNKSCPKTDVSEHQGIGGLRLSTFPPLTTTAQTSLLSQSTLQKETVALVRDSSFSPITENSSPFVFSVKHNSNSDLKALDSTSVFTSVPKIDLVEDLISKKDQNGNDLKSENIFGNAVSSTCEIPAPKSSGSSFLFSTVTEDSSTPTAAPSSNPPAFPSFTIYPPFNVFGFGSITSPSTTSGAETVNTNTTGNNLLNSIMTTTSPFSTSFATTTTTTTTGSSL
ncbi:uncharacterized protein [Rutidosis leptorrhynchoides]